MTSRRPAHDALPPHLSALVVHSHPASREAYREMLAACGVQRHRRRTTARRRYSCCRTPRPPSPAATSWSSVPRPAPTSRHTPWPRRSPCTRDTRRLPAVAAVTHGTHRSRADRPLETMLHHQHTRHAKSELRAAILQTLGTAHAPATCSDRARVGARRATAADPVGRRLPRQSRGGGRPAGTQRPPGATRCPAAGKRSTRCRPTRSTSC